VQPPPEYQKLLTDFPGLFREQEPLAPLVRFRVGGPADLFCQPQDLDTLRAVVTHADKKEIPLFVMGDGTNLLVQDGGMRGLVLRLGKGFKEIRVDGDCLYAGCAAKLPRVCLHAAGQGLAGLEGLSGIPGTVGGAIAMNAGTPESTACETLESLKVCEPDGLIRVLGKEAFRFAYRRFYWEDGTPLEKRILLEACWRLRKGEAQILRQQIRQALRRRKACQPVAAASAGCIFKNPCADMPAGRLIDEAGFKGMQRGDAMVSPRHANFIINQGKARASDILSLITWIQEQILETQGILLEKEVRIVGETSPV
jgi:UDP-N-acetylmuramate dehydrogenase